jgi:hypothetical protein
MHPEDAAFCPASPSPSPSPKPSPYLPSPSPVIPGSPARSPSPAPYGGSRPIQSPAPPRSEADARLCPPMDSLPACVDGFAGETMTYFE